MKTTSLDGTELAHERCGDGPPLVLVSGSLQSGASFGPLADELARHLTVLTYDRRARGASGDTTPYAVDREVEDLGAIIDVAGGTASVYGHSSGAALVLHAAARGLAMECIVLHEPPFGSGGEEEERGGTGGGRPDRRPARRGPPHGRHRPVPGRHGPAGRARRGDQP